MYGSFISSKPPTRQGLGDLRTTCPPDWPSAQFLPPLLLPSVHHRSLSPSSLVFAAWKMAVDTACCVLGRDTAPAVVTWPTYLVLLCLMHEPMLVVGGQPSCQRQVGAAHHLRSHRHPAGSTGCSVIWTASREVKWADLPSPTRNPSCGIKYEPRAGALAARYLVYCRLLVPCHRGGWAMALVHPPPLSLGRVKVACDAM